MRIVTARRAGIRTGDRIVAMNGHPVINSCDIAPLVHAAGNRPMTIDIERDGAHLRVRATPQGGMLGITYTLFGFGGGDSDETFVPPPDIPIPDPPPPPPFIPPPVNNN
jgi:hypothetical protein